MTFGNVLDAQDGIFHADQACAHGLTRSAIRHQLATGRWQRVLPRVYAAFPGKLSERQRLRATLLYAGRDAMLSGGAALHVYGVRSARPLPALALVPAGNQRQSSGFAVLRRTARLDEHTRVVDGLRVAGVARAVADEARRQRDLTEARALVAEVVQSRLTTVPRLTAELSAGAHRGSRLLRVALGDVTVGCGSAPEAELRDLVRASRVLPEPRWNVRLETLDGKLLGMPDAWWEEAALVAEVDSREWHLTPEAWEHTMRRHMRFTAYGLTVAHFAPRRLRKDARTLLREMEAMYLLGLAQGRRALVRARGPHRAA